jgi:nitrogen fixation/metabolism regulation signal transduction histidine kinase
MGLVRSLQRQPLETRALIHWSSDARGDETVYAIPLFAPDRRLLAIFLVGNSRRNYVELARGIRRAALLAALAGVLLATLLSGWAAARVTRPVEQLARAAREVTEGDWSAQVPVPSSCELKELATSFNRMTRELDEQKDRLVQAERVAAWRELARRLAHELKNPLFPLQLTVENLLRSRQQSATMFEETFAESSSTLLAEIANLNAIVSRFSDFSKMPQPQWQLVDLNEVVQGVARLHQARLAVASPAGVTSEVDLAQDMEPVVADPDLLHQALSNLVLNAFDAMPEGGRLTLRTRQRGEWSCLEVSDTGTGIPAEERARLFTPYYTTKAHGTGLGLAIVQSVASDHGARVTARSEAGRGTTFLIELPRNRERLGRRVLQASANRSKT